MMAGSKVKQQDYPDKLYDPLPHHLLDGRSWEGSCLAGVAWIIPALKVGFHLGAMPLTQGRTYTKFPVFPNSIRWWWRPFNLDPDEMRWEPSLVRAIDDRNPVSDELLLYGPKAKAEGVVYFIQMDGFPVVKIGHTSNGSPTARLGQLQTACPYQLKVIATTPGTYLDEFNFHKRFSDLRIRPDGEWFHLRGELADFIAMLGRNSRTEHSATTDMKEATHNG